MDTREIAEEATQEIVATIVTLLNVDPQDFSTIGKINSIAAAIQGTVERAITKSAKTIFDEICGANLDS